MAEELERWAAGLPLRLPTEHAVTVRQHLAVSQADAQPALTGRDVQRVALSATQRPMEEIGRFVSGGRPIRLVDAGRAKELDLRVVVPVEDMREPAMKSPVRESGPVEGVWGNREVPPASWRAPS